MRKLFKNNKGYTLAELLIVVAIIGILAGFGFVAASTHQRKLKLKEMDSAAKEIFLSAQSYLTAAWADGELEAKKELFAEDSLPEDYFGIPNGESKYSSNVYVNNRGEEKAVGQLLLPYGAIDSTIRDNGSYLINYDVDTATVTDVYYAEYGDNLLNGKSLSDLNALVTSSNSERIRNARNNKSSISGKPNYIGYYGGEDIDSIDKQDGLLSPSVVVKNEENLWLEIIDPNYGDYESYIEITYKGNQSGDSISKYLPREAGKNLDSSKLERESDDYCKIATVDNFFTGRTYGIYYVLIDSITAGENGHFANRFEDEDGNQLFIPGEDMMVSVTVKSEYVNKNIETTSRTFNSLFADSLQKVRNERGEWVDNNYKVNIRNGRHLQNLSKNISGFFNDRETYVDKCNITTANIVSDITWDYRINEDIENYESFWSQIALEKSKHIQMWESFFKDWTNEDGIYDVTGHKIGGNNFSAINLPVAEFTLNGNRYKLSDFSIVSTDTSENGKNIGLFGTIPNGHILTVKNLFLVNPNINQKDANNPSKDLQNVSAGALIGANHGNIDVENCGVYASATVRYTKDSDSENKAVVYTDILKEEKDTYKTDPLKYAEESSKEYSAGAFSAEKGSKSEDDGRRIYVSSGYAGGLVGYSDGTTIAQKSFASVPVVASDKNTTSSNNVAGGLYGYIKNKGIIEKCYSGGMTTLLDEEAENDGKDKDKGEDDPPAQEEEHQSTEEDEDKKSDYFSNNIGVAAFGTNSVAGALVGEFSNMESGQVDKSYSTASVVSGNTSGGFIGKSANNINITNCYTLGNTFIYNENEETAKSGQFFGEAGGNITNCAVLERPSSFASNDEYAQENMTMPEEPVYNNEDVSKTIKVLPKEEFKDAFKAVSDVNTSGTTYTVAYSITEEDYPYPVFGVKTGHKKEVNTGTTNASPNVHFGDWPNPEEASTYLPLTVRNDDVLSVSIDVPKTEKNIILMIMGEISGLSNEENIEGFVQIAFERDTEDETKLKILKDDKTYDEIEYATIVEKDDETDTFTIKLDDITIENGHFTSICNVEESKLIPGENIYILALTGKNKNKENDIKKLKTAIKEKLEDSTKTITENDEECFAKTNSLFGYAEEETSQTTAEKEEEVINVSAKIYSFRHLENLTNKVSGIQDTLRIEAIQTKDLIWKDSSNTQYTQESPVIPFVNNIKTINNTETVRIYTNDNESLEQPEVYYPVENSKLIIYDGDNHYIQNVSILDEDNLTGIGIFANFGNNETTNTEQYEIRDLFLKNIYINTINNNINVGTLTGASYNTDISNILVFADKTYEEKNGYGDETNAKTGIVSNNANNIGGLAGYIKNGNITDCASAIKVTGTATNAGGLIGNALSSTIKTSYSGGHTYEGQYSEVKTGNSIAYNIENGSGISGGFIGTADSCRMENCYSTCSAYGDRVGGFIGYPLGSYIFTSASYGLVNGNKVGIFSGYNDFRGDSNVYLEGLNANRTGIYEGVNGTRLSGIEMPQEEGSASAYRYDQTNGLPQNFPFTVVKSFTINEHEYGHVGDWQVVTSEDVVFYVDNGNRLTLVCRTTNKEGYIRVCVVGESSENSKTYIYPVENLITNGRNQNAAYHDDVVYIYLDDVTTHGGHFKELFPTLTAGEDITIYADFTLENQNLNIEEDFAEYIPVWNASHNALKDKIFVEHINSLFANRYTTTNDDAIWENGNSNLSYAVNVDDNTAIIANIRHYQNLDTSVSEIGSEITKAIQVENLQWKKTATYKKSNVANETYTKPAAENITDGYTFYEDLGCNRSDGQNTYNKNGNVLNSRSNAWKSAFTIALQETDESSAQPAVGYLYGVRNDNIEEYDGNGYSVYNIEIKVVPTISTFTMQSTETVSSEESKEGSGFFRNICMEKDFYIHDINFKNVDIYGHNAGCIAGGAGYVTGNANQSVAHNELVLENITINGDVNVKGRRYAAGFVGVNYTNITADKCGIYSSYGVVMDVWKDFTSSIQLGTGTEAGGGSSGGFVGNMHANTFHISNSFASIYVYGYQNDNSGGFIGRMGYMHSYKANPSYIRNCYVGGHTVNGIYEDTMYARPGQRGAWPSDSKPSIKKQRLVAGQNVVGGVNTGGFIGFYQLASNSTSAAYFEDCFTTASVGGTKETGAVGGFFSKNQAGGSRKSIFKNCYTYNRIYYHNANKDKVGSFMSLSNATYENGSENNVVIPLNEDLRMMGDVENDEVLYVREESPYSANVIEEGHTADDSVAFDVYYKNQRYPFKLNDYLNGNTFYGDWERSSELDSYSLPFAFNNEDRLTLDIDVPRNEVGTNAYVTIVLRDVISGNMKYGCMWVRSWDSKPYFIPLTADNKTQINATEYFEDKLYGTTIKTDDIMEISDFSIDSEYSTIQMVFDDMSKQNMHFGQLYKNFTIGGDIEAYISLGFDKDLCTKIRSGEFQVTDTYKVEPNKTFQRAVSMDENHQVAFEEYKPVQYEWNDSDSLTGKVRMSRTNSLFSDDTCLEEFNPQSNILNRKAGIRSFRHFQNMENYVSNLDSTKTSVKYTSAVQLSDIQWAGDSDSKLSYLNRMAEIYNTDRDSIVIYNRSGAVASQPGFFFGVQSTDMISYSGDVSNGKRNPRIWDLKLTRSKDNVATNNHTNYGTLFKEVKGVTLTIENVDVYNSDSYEINGLVMQRAGIWVSDVWSGGKVIMRNMKIAGDHILAKQSYNGSDGKSSAGLLVCRLNGGTAEFNNITIEAENIEIESPRTTGLFVGILTNSAVVTANNCTLNGSKCQNCTLKSTQKGFYTGGFAGDANSKSRLEITNITNTIPNFSVLNYETDTSYSGGIIGRVYDSTLRTTNVTINSDRLKVKGGLGVGGIVGCAEGSKTNAVEVTVTNTHVYGKYAYIGQHKTANDNNAGAGGLAGILTGTNVRYTFTDSSATAYVKGYIAGGLIGRINSNIKTTDQINGCYAAGHYKYNAEKQKYDYKNIVFDAENPTTTEGGYNVNGSLIAGGFIGKANKVDINNSFSSCSVANVAAKQSTSSAGSFVGSDGTDISVKNSYSIGQVITANSIPAGAMQGATNNNGTFTNCSALITEGSTTGRPASVTIYSDEENMMIDEDSRVQASTYNMQDTKYPYLFYTVNTTSDQTYHGDWILDMRMLNGDFGILYYEKVQHGHSQRMDTYFKGYLFNEGNTNGIENHGLKSMIENGIKNEHVVNDIYVLIVRDEIDLSELKIVLPDNTETSISECNFIEEDTSISDDMEIDGYHIYKIDRNNATLTALLKEDNLHEISLKDKDGIVYTLYINPYTGNGVSIEEPDDIYYIRSAGQLHDIASVTNEGHSVIENLHIIQTMDISYANDIDYEYNNYAFVPMESFAGTYEGFNENIELNKLSNLFAEQIEETAEVKTLTISNMEANEFTSTLNGKLQNLSFKNCIYNGNLVDELISETGIIEDCHISNSTLFENGITLVNNGLITETNITNATIHENGFVGTNNGIIRDCYIINANIGKDGFVGINDNEDSIIENCQIYSDNNKYIETNYYKENIYTYDINISSQKQSKGYNLVVIGIIPESNPYELEGITTITPTRQSAGFVGTMRDGTIKNCSITGKVIGKDASGFVTHHEGGLIKNSYSECYLYSSDTEGWASGFAYDIYSGATIEYCHAGGLIDGEFSGTGFIHIINIGNEENNPNINHCYSNIFNIDIADAYYPFTDTNEIIDEATSKNKYPCCSDIYYMMQYVNDSLYGTVYPPSPALKAQIAVLSAALSQMEELGNIHNNISHIYKQYRNNNDDFPYPIPLKADNTVMEFYGDWNIDVLDDDENTHNVVIDLNGGTTNNPAAQEP